MFFHSLANVNLQKNLIFYLNKTSFFNFIIIFLK